MMAEPGETPLYRWPRAAQFGRVVPKSKFYEHGKVSAAVRQRFVDEVRRTIWAYKLAEATINLPGTLDVPEIQVFQIDAKAGDVSDVVLEVIDKAVKMPIIFEISRGDGISRLTRMAATHKQLRTGNPKLGAYYSTAWQSAEAERRPLPAAINLSGLYSALLGPLTSIRTHPGEGMSYVVAKLEIVRALEREIPALERKLRTEPQLNRKVELRRVLRTKQAALADLTNPSYDRTANTKN